jgi:hypothetical protein
MFGWVEINVIHFKNPFFKLMNQIEKLINYYLTSKNVNEVDTVLDKIVSLSTNYNYPEIINLIENHKEKKLDTEVSLYINEIAHKKFTGLEKVIINRLKITIDKGVIEDLEEALEKLKAPTDL